MLIGARVHLILVKLPPETFAFHDTVPVGALTVPELVSVTVAVNSCDPPKATDIEFGDNVVDVVPSIVNFDLPELI